GKISNHLMQVLVVQPTLKLPALPMREVTIRVAFPVSFTSMALDLLTTSAHHKQSSASLHKAPCITKGSNPARLIQHVDNIDRQDNIVRTFRADRRAEFRCIIVAIGIEAFVAQPLNVLPAAAAEVKDALARAQLACSQQSSWFGYAGSRYCRVLG